MRFAHPFPRYKFFPPKSRNHHASSLPTTFNIHLWIDSDILLGENKTDTIRIQMIRMQKSIGRPGETPKNRPTLTICLMIVWLLDVLSRMFSNVFQHVPLLSFPAKLFEISSFGTKMSNLLSYRQQILSLYLIIKASFWSEVISDIKVITSRNQHSGFPPAPEDLSGLHTVEIFSRDNVLGSQALEGLAQFSQTIE